MSCSIQQKTHLTLVTGGEGYNAMYKRIHTQNLPLAKENITLCTTEHKPNTYRWLRMILCCVRQTTNPALVIGGVAITLCTTHLWWTGISCFVQHNTNPTLIVRGGGYYAVHNRTQTQHLRHWQRAILRSLQQNTNTTLTITGRGRYYALFNRTQTQHLR